MIKSFIIKIKSFYYIKTELCRDSKDLEAKKQLVRTQGTMTPPCQPPRSKVSKAKMSPLPAES